MSFGDVIRSANSPGGDPNGIGGDANTIWHCDFYTAIKLYELSTSDFSVVRNIASPNTGPSGIGGDTNTIWHCDYNIDLIYELNTSDMSVARSASSPLSNPQGIGGDNNTIWHCDWNNEKFYELSTSDLSVIRSTSSGTLPSGMGGNANNIWNTLYAEKIYELSTTDFSIVRSSSAPSYKPMGIGGDTETIWLADYYIDKIYELDAASIVTVSGTVSDEFGNTIRDADITISNGTTYTTTSDENGAYSQVVNSDTYDIAVSKSRSTYHDITISSVAVTADTTQDITMLLDKMLGSPSKPRYSPKGISIPGGISMGRSRR
jgi:hypothetical protein